jgi:hypothetical protein
LKIWLLKSLLIIIIIISADNAADDDLVFEKFFGGKLVHAL